MAAETDAKRIERHHREHMDCLSAICGFLKEIADNLDGNRFTTDHTPVSSGGVDNLKVYTHPLKFWKNNG